MKTVLILLLGLLGMMGTISWAGTELDAFREALAPEQARVRILLEEYSDVPPMHSTEGEIIDKQKCLSLLSQIKSNYPTDPLYIRLDIEKQALQFPFCTREFKEWAQGSFTLPEGKVAAQVVREKGLDTFAQVAVKRSIFLSADSKIEGIFENTHTLTERKTGGTRAQFFDREGNARSVGVDINFAGEVFARKRSLVGADGILSYARLTEYFGSNPRTTFTMRVVDKVDWKNFWIALPFVSSFSGIYEYVDLPDYTPKTIRTTAPFTTRTLTVVTEAGVETCVEGTVRTGNGSRRVDGSSSTGCK